MKIICIGRNYAEHAKELKNELPSEPLFFMKPDTALVQNNCLYHPSFSHNIHYEAEIVLKISKMGKYIDEKFAQNYFQEISVGLDFTARDLQDICKAKGLPWEKAKAFDGSAAVGKFIPISSLKNVEQLDFELFRNNIRVQQGNTSDLIFSFSTIISYISEFITLKVGDLIFTGTPAGVGKIEIGDQYKGNIEGQELLNIKIA